MTVSGTRAALVAVPRFPGKEASMDPVTHEQAAAELARHYATGDEATRHAIAATCEEQGILAALVVLALLPEHRAGFLQAMKASVTAAE
jgi:hypothetical protein